jgi:hypothetical protein
MDQSMNEMKPGCMDLSEGENTNKDIKPMLAKSGVKMQVTAGFVESSKEITRRKMHKNYKTIKRRKKDSRW